MPFYEYVCTLCGTEKTILQKISDAPAVDCPACGKPGLIKQISAAGFRLKGGGWYETDFKSDNKKNLAGEGSNGGGDAKPAGKDGDKSADKPAAKTPEKANDVAAAKPVDKGTPAPAAASKPAATPPAAT